jgi:ribosomal protein S18 acetylase RimI-like enzyme
VQEIQIRQLAPTDYNRIVKLWQKAGLPVKPEGRDSYHEISRQMSQSPDFFLGATIDGQLAGIVIISSDGRKGYLNRIAVDPQFRGQGVAQKLTMQAEKTLRGKGIKIITLLIHNQNLPSIQLAHKLGYVRHDDIIYFSKRDSDRD